mmetsp:Transcript_17752/g.44472  ORF Transcript_17752/g.44472 Transcript_17752/m.44472 type:complete len:88 (+) Transcript_17752:63-326(+)|eukprot:2758669-Prymnesium_polylepis.1
MRAGSTDNMGALHSGKHAHVCGDFTDEQAGCWAMHAVRAAWNWEMRERALPAVRQSARAGPVRASLWHHVGREMSDISVDCVDMLLA